MLMDDPDETIVVDFERGVIMSSGGISLANYVSGYDKDTILAISGVFSDISEEESRRHRAITARNVENYRNM